MATKHYYESPWGEPEPDTGKGCLLWGIIGAIVLISSILICIYSQ